MEATISRRRVRVPNKIRALTPAKQGDNAKVKVQYIKNHQIVDNARKTQLIKQRSQPQQATTVVVEEEAENVEYLDESTNEEFALNEKCEQRGGANADTFVDTFYPNAIHCLITLYRLKYQEMQGKSVQQIREMHVWEHIAKEMYESFFNFDRVQIRQKFRQLREQYFSIKTLDEIDAFEYFDQMHEIYQDKAINAIATSEVQTANETPCKRAIYFDEELLDRDEVTETQSVLNITKQQAAGDNESIPNAQAAEVDEIAHKEHEFIDMVEKELQAMEAGNNVAADCNQRMSVTHTSSNRDATLQGSTPRETVRCNAGNNKQTMPQPIQVALIKSEQLKQNKEESKAPLPAKRFKIETTPTIFGIHAVHTTPTAESHLATSQKTNAMSNALVEISLAEYNTQQERRHQEKMELWRQSLQIQERSIAMQQQLMEQLIKRL